MSIYSKYILPKAIHSVCGSETSTRQRQKLIPQAEGRVLEVGIGSGFNLAFYDPKRVTEVIGIDPSVELLQMAAETARDAPFPVQLLELSGEAMPFADDSFDTIVTTYTLCTIPDVDKALGEMRRLLKKGGRLLFSEHGTAPDKWVYRTQIYLNPVWKIFSGGCNLDRPISELIARNGFKIKKLEKKYISDLRFVSFNYLGIAVQA